jgi:hypothetical protein
MKKTNTNFSQNELQNMFFGKDTITNLNKILQQQTNMESANKDMKQELVNTLVKNMKTVYRSIDMSKINSTNFNSIFDQFKKHSIIESINDFKSNDTKFKRDFTSNPNSGNKLMDRPQSTKYNEQPSQSSNSFQGYNASSGYESSLDQVFKPIVENPDDNKFNNYSSGRGKDTMSKMEDVQKSRQSEVALRNQRPPTPDFLKTQKTNPDKNTNTNISKPITQNNMKGGKPDFVNANSAEMNQGFQGLANDMGENLYSLDNIDKPLIEMEMVEDAANFEDRLKKLQNERGTLKPIQNNGSQIDFTSDNYKRSDNISDNNFQRQNIQEEQPNTNMNSRPSMIENQPNTNMNSRPSMIENQPNTNMNSRPRMIENQPNTNMNSRPRMIENQPNTNMNSRPHMIENQPNTNINQEANIDKFTQIKNSMKSVNIMPNDQFKKIIEKLENENQELMFELNKLKEDKTYDKLDEIKQQIADEFVELSNKKEEIENKLITINLKESELAKKEADIKQLITNYDYLFKSNQLQIEVTNQENKSNYMWNMNMIPNVTGIKLMSYSLPLPRYNIHINKNNILKIKKDTKEYNIEINSGKYNIEELISILNQKINTLQLNIIITINTEQHIVIESKEEFELIPTNLLKYNMGFVTNKIISSSYVSDKIWDLRIDSMVYLYLNNLSDDIPFGVLYFNNISSCQFKFEKPFNLNVLEIVFKDSMGNDYNFYNLPHSLSFMIDRIN